MDNLQTIINPTIGIITNISEAHQENFSTMQEKCREKLALFKGCDILIYNADNPLIAGCINQSLLPSREIAWSQKDSDKPLYIKAIKKEDNGTTVQYRYLTFDSS